MSGNIMTGGTYVTLCHTFVTCQVFQEELARTRELPVPPQPRRSGVLARSDDNLTGEAPLLGITSHGALLFTLHARKKAKDREKLVRAQSRGRERDKK